MDKNHQLLNALLDEIDFLETQLEEAVAEEDYELAHQLQEALFFKRHTLYELEKVFMPVQKRRWPPPTQFVVSDAPAQSVFTDLLKALLQKDTDILALQLRFIRRYPFKSTESISIYHNPLTHKVNMVLTKPDPLYFQMANLKQIGWKRDEEDTRRFLYALGGRKNAYFQKLKLVIARTVFEVIDKYDIKTELKVVKMK